jgi:hypothetical protein
MKTADTYQNHQSGASNIQSNNQFATLAGLLLIVLIFFLACQKDEIVDPSPKEPQPYSFFVAGHTRGIYYADNIGLHPPFLDKFNLINQRKTELGFLLGDIVSEGTNKNWNEVDSVLKILDSEVFFAVGNHDVTDRPLYESRYGKTFFNFKDEGDLFIILDPNIDQWNISGDQLIFLQDLLESEISDTINIFVLFHQLMWWEKDNKYGELKLNSLEDKADTLNFWTEIEPLFNALPNEVYMFAGDIGAAHWSDDAMYDHFDNITLIATGMGEGIGDNFVFIDVDENGEVSFEMIALNGDDIHAMGNIEDYQVP